MFQDKNRYKGNVNFFIAMGKYLAGIVGAYLLFTYLISPFIPWGTINHALGIDKIKNPLTGLMSNPSERPVALTQPNPDTQPVTIPVTAPVQGLNHDQLNAWHFHWIKSDARGIFDYGKYNPNCDCFEMHNGANLAWSPDLIVIGHTDDTQIKVYDQNDPSTNVYYIIGPLPDNALYMDGNLMPDGSYIIGRLVKIVSGEGYVFEEHNGTQHLLPWIHGGFVAP